MKTCTKCGVEKPEHEFYKSFNKKRAKWRVEASCKICTVKRTSNYRREYRANATWKVYILPNANYAGITKYMSERFSKHRLEYGRDTEGGYMVAEYDNVYDAIIHEAKLHKSGYKGCQYDRNTI